MTETSESSRRLVSETLHDVVTHAQSIGDDGQSRIHGAAGDEEAPIHHVKVVHVMRAAVQIQNRGLRILAEFAGANLVPRLCIGIFVVK